jgi:hypothetical protein
MYMHIYIFISMFTCIYMLVKLELYFQIDKCLHPKSTHTGKLPFSVFSLYLHDFCDFEFSSTRTYIYTTRYDAL